MSTHPRDAEYEYKEVSSTHVDRFWESVTRNGDQGWTLFQIFPKGLRDTDGYDIVFYKAIYRRKLK